MCSTFDWAGRVMTGHCHANLVETPSLMAPGPIKPAGICLSSCLVTVNRQFANPPNLTGLPPRLGTLLNSLGMDRMPDSRAKRYSLQCTTGEHFGVARY